MRTSHELTNAVNSLHFIKCYSKAAFYDTKLLRCFLIISVLVTQIAVLSQVSLLQDQADIFIRTRIQVFLTTKTLGFVCALLTN